LPTPFADSWDTAAHIITQLGTPASGLFYRMRVCNDTNFVDTISPLSMSGVAGTITVPGDTNRRRQRLFEPVGMRPALPDKSTQITPMTQIRNDQKCAGSIPIALDLRNLRHLY
jgi:hypothetical protein